MSSIAAGLTSGTALVNTGDTTGSLVFKTNGTTTALTLDTSQNATLVGNASVGGTLGVTSNATVGGTLGVTGASTLAAATLSGDLSMGGNEILNSALGTNSVSSSSNVTTLNYQNGAVFTSTATENTTLTPSNVPAGGCTILLKLTNGGAYTISFAGTPTFEGGTAPTLTASGTDFLFLVCTSATNYAVFTKLDVKAAA
jgi:hypothetical protein